MGGVIELFIGLISLKWTRDHLYTVKWFQMLLSNTNKSIRY